MMIWWLTMSPADKARLRRGGRGTVTLRSGDAQLEAAPLHGGTLVSWNIAGIELLRRCPPGQTDPLQSACFPLAPFSNVVRGGGFHFQDRFHPLDRNHPLESEPIHGDSWLSPWTMDELAGDRLLMSYAHTAARGFPFRYHVSQELVLHRRCLTITLRLTNADVRAMPAGLGLHPYFHRHPGTRLHARHDGRWERTRALADSRFCLPEEIGDDTIDVCYAGWSGLACLWPRDGVVVTIRAAAPASALVVYSPAGSDFVCVEPVTNVNDGFNAAASGSRETGVRTLRPKEHMSLRVTMSVHLSGSPWRNPISSG